MRYLLLCLVCVASACDRPEQAVMASAAQDAASKFHGSWTLVSWTDKNDDGETVSPYGENPFGRIMYAPSGKMAVVLMGDGREIEGTGGLAQLEPDDMRTVLTRFFAYSGSFTVDEEAGTVTHHIEAALAPAWVGGDRVRTYEMLSDDRIRLRPQEGTSQLTWQRER